MDESGQPIWLRRFLDQGTTWQKLLLAIGAIAGALLAVGGLAVSINQLVDGDGQANRLGSPSAPAVDDDRIFVRAEPLASESADVDGLVALLLVASEAYAADQNDPEARVALQFSVDSEPANSGRITLGYRCPNEPPCVVDLQAWEPTQFDVTRGATFFEGVYVVRVQRGRAERDIEFGLRKVGTI